MLYTVAASLANKLQAKPLGMQASIIRCLSQARINWEGCDRKGIRRKNAEFNLWLGVMEVGALIVRMKWRPDRGPIISAFASVIFPCTIKSRRWRAIMAKVCKGCSEFCVTVDTVTRTGGILIRSRLKALAVHLSWPSGRLWLYAGLIWSNNPGWLKADLVVYGNPSSSSSWV